MHSLYVLTVIFIAKILCDTKPEVEDYLNDPKKEVKIEILEVPKDCTRKSQRGDICTTDYVGYFPDGKEFDST